MLPQNDQPGTTELPLDVSRSLIAETGSCLVSADPVDSQHAALTDEFGAATQALDQRLVVVTQIVNGQNPAALHFCENRGQIAPNFVGLVQHVGEDKIESPRHLSEIARLKRHVTVQVVLLQLKSGVLRCR